MKKLTLVLLTLAIVIPVMAEDDLCVSESAPFYDDWIAFGMPDCWCYQYNCKGDFSGTSQGSAFGGWMPVFGNDLSPLLYFYGVKEPPKGPGVGAAGICADFGRDKQGSAFGGWKRVFNSDLTILLANYGLKLPPKTPTISGDCSGSDYNFFLTP
jgi:hypothetical protein